MNGFFGELMLNFKIFVKRIRTGPYSSAAQKGHLYLLSMWQNRAKNEKRKWKRHQKVRRLLCSTRWVWTASRPKREKSQKRRSSIGRCKSFINLFASTAWSKTVSLTFFLAFKITDETENSTIFLKFWTVGWLNYMTFICL